MAALVVTGVGLDVARNRRRATVRPVQVQSKVERLTPRGEAVDWMGRTRPVADLPGRVHCFSMLTSTTARVVWGAPRRAEDVDLVSGRRQASALDPTSYLTGCPELSPSGRQLLFDSQNQAGASEIRLSDTPDGKGARVITSGADPMWLGREGDEFVYDVDTSHEAVYSLPTMRFLLLGDPGFGVHRMIVDKAVNEGRDMIALLFCDESLNYAVSVYHGANFEKVKTLASPAVHRVQFGWDSRTLLVSYQLSGAVSTLGALDWGESSLNNIGRYPGFDVVRAHLSNRYGAQGDPLLARHVSSDLWYDDGVRHEQLSTDGRTYSGDRSPSGDLLLSRWNDDGTLNIWRLGAAGQTRQLSHGQTDVEPRFSPDGHHWLYADYKRKGLMLCSFDTGECKVLVEDELPSYPMFSPDGKNIAYIVQTGSPKLKVVSVPDGSERASWDAHAQCPPAWTSPSRVWTLETSGGRYAWSERDITTGDKTGNQSFEEKAAPSFENECPVPFQSRFLRHLRVERHEISRLVTFN